MKIIFFFSYHYCKIILNKSIDLLHRGGISPIKGQENRNYLTERKKKKVFLSSSNLEKFKFKRF
jgi:hypothetical protein